MFGEGIRENETDRRFVNSARGLVDRKRDRRGRPAIFAIVGCHRSGTTRPR